jgi:threonine dehydratase
MSAGNHAQAVAYHGARLGIATTVVMPEGAPLLKVRRTREYGATVVQRGETLDEAAAYVRTLIATTGATFVPPFDDANIICGQGTATLEFLEDVGAELDILLVPIGGGGLIAGAALAMQALDSHATLVGVQAELYAGVAATQSGGTVAGGATIAEGIAVSHPGRLPLEVMHDRVREVILVSEAQIETAIAALLEDEKLVVEGAGAAGVAALLADPARFAGKRVGTILCGGNIDLGTLASVMVRHRMRSGRVVCLRVQLVDKPGGLAGITLAISEAGANVLEVLHHRGDIFGTLSAKYAEVDVTIEVERPEDVPAIIAAIARHGFAAHILTG